MTGRAYLVTRRADWRTCRSTHPLTREQCVIGPWGHELHWTQHTGSWWNTDDGRSTSPVGQVYVTYFGRYVPHPGHETDGAIEHFPDPYILRSELVSRTQHGYGTAFEPGGFQRRVRYNSPAAHAYMDVWVMVSPDPSVSDPVPDWHTPPMERWSIVGTEYQRSAYLSVVPR